MKTDLVIGLDSSTTTTKAIAWDRRGRAVAEGRAGVPMSNPKPGWFEQDVGDWTNGAAKALKPDDSVMLLIRRDDVTSFVALTVPKAEAQ